MHLNRLEQLLLSIELIKDEFTFTHADLVVGHFDSALRYGVVFVAVAIDFHLFREDDVRSTEAQVNRTLLLSCVAELGPVDGLVPILA